MLVPGHWAAAALKQARLPVPAALQCQPDERGCRQPATPLVPQEIAKLAADVEKEGLGALSCKPPPWQPVLALRLTHCRGVGACCAAPFETSDTQPSSLARGCSRLQQRPTLHCPSTHRPSGVCRLVPPGHNPQAALLRRQHALLVGRCNRWAQLELGCGSQR